VVTLLNIFFFLLESEDIRKIILKFPLKLELICVRWRGLVK